MVRRLLILHSILITVLVMRVLGGYSAAEAPQPSIVQEQSITRSEIETHVNDKSFGPFIEREKAQLLLVDLGSPSELHVRPVDPASLISLPGYEPISLGHHYSSALSPDGSLLAVITWPSGSPRDAGTERDVGVLHLIHLESWTDEVTSITFPGQMFVPMVFSPDGGTLYWMEHGLAAGRMACLVTISYIAMTLARVPRQNLQTYLKTTNHGRCEC